MGNTFTPATFEGIAASAQLNQFIAPVNALEDGTFFWATEDAASAADVYVADTTNILPPDPLTAGYVFRLLVTNANTGASTLDVDTTDGALAVKKRGGTALVAGDLEAGMVADLVFDGTDWELQNPGAGAGDLEDLGDVTITAAAKGDLLVHNGTAWVDLTVGTNDHVLTADSSETTGVKWAAAGGGGSVSGYLAVLNSIMAALGAGDANIDAKYTDGEYVGLLYSSTDATTTEWLDATATHTVTAGKKLVIVEMAGSDGLSTNPGNEKIQLYGDGNLVLPDSYFSAYIRLIGVRESANMTAGKVVNLQHYHGTNTVKPTGWVIFREVNA